MRLLDQRGLRFNKRDLLSDLTGLLFNQCGKVTNSRSSASGENSISPFGAQSQAMTQRITRPISKEWTLTPGGPEQ